MTEARVRETLVNTNKSKDVKVKRTEAELDKIMSDRVGHISYPICATCKDACSIFFLGRVAVGHHSIRLSAVVHIISTAQVRDLACWASWFIRYVYHAM